jgi:hypothetical protein
VLRAQAARLMPEPEVRDERRCRLPRLAEELLTQMGQQPHRLGHPGSVRHRPTAVDLEQQAVLLQLLEHITRIE